MGTHLDLSRRLDIQGLRALAVVLVVFSHLPGLGKFVGGFVGVDVFFVISGYVITRLLIAKHEVGPKPFMSEYFKFMLRRIQRLVPALFTMILVVVALGFLLGPPLEFGSTAKGAFWSELFASNFFFLKNFDTYWNPELLRNPFLHTWSLGIEFQIYLFLPFLLVSLLTLGTANSRSLSRATIWVALFSTLSLLGFVILTTPLLTFENIDATGAAFYLPVTRLWEFGAGALAVLLVSRIRSSGSKKTLFLVAGWALLFGGTLSSHFVGSISVALIAVVLGTAIILYIGELHRRSLSYQALGSKPMVWLGDRSYSFYLWHWPMLMVVAWITPGNQVAPLVAVVIALLLADRSFALLERRRWSFTLPPQLRRRPWLRFVAPLAMLMLIPALTVGFALAGSSTWYQKPFVVDYSLPEGSKTAAEITEVMNDCDVLEKEMHCDFFGTGTPEIVIIGDSLSYRAFPAVATAARENGYNASELWEGGCSIEVNSCPDFVYEYLDTHNIAAVLVTTNYDRESSVLNAAEIAGGEIPECAVKKTRDCPAHQKAIEDFKVASAKGLSQLRTWTPNVLVAQPFPQQSAEKWTALYPPLYKRIGTSPTTQGATPLDWQIERQGYYPEAIAEATKSVPGFTVWNPTDYLCSEGTCPGVINGTEQIFDDPIHWSWPASRFLYEPIFQFVSDLR